jgi:hypothetical protein
MTWSRISANHMDFKMNLFKNLIRVNPGKSVAENFACLI